MSKQQPAPAAPEQDGVPQADLERFARFLLPKIQAFTSRRRDNGCSRSGKRNNKKPEHTFSKDCAPGFYEKGREEMSVMVLYPADGPLRAGNSEIARMVGGVVGHHLLEGIVFCQGLALPVGTMHAHAGKPGQALPRQPGSPGAWVTAPVSTTPPALAKASAKASAAGVRSCGPLRKQNPWAGGVVPKGSTDTSCSAARASGRTQVWSVASTCVCLQKCASP